MWRCLMTGPSFALCYKQSATDLHSSSLQNCCWLLVGTKLLHDACCTVAAVLSCHVRLGRGPPRRRNTHQLLPVLMHEEGESIMFGRRAQHSSCTTAMCQEGSLQLGHNDSLQLDTQHTLQIPLCMLTRKEPCTSVTPDSCLEHRSSSALLPVSQSVSKGDQAVPCSTTSS